MKKSIKIITYTMLALFISLVIYFVLFNKISQRIYCHRKTNFQRYNYRQSVVRNGAPEDVDHDKNVAKEVNVLYEQCLKNDF